MGTWDTLIRLRETHAGPPPVAIEIVNSTDVMDSLNKTSEKLVQMMLHSQPSAVTDLVSNVTNITGNH